MLDKYLSDPQAAYHSTVQSDGIKFEQEGEDMDSDMLVCEMFYQFIFVCCNSI